MPDRSLTLRITRSPEGYSLAVAHKTKDGDEGHSETHIEQEKDDLSASILAAACADATALYLTRCGDDDRKAVAESPIGKAARG